MSDMKSKIGLYLGIAVMVVLAMIFAFSYIVDPAGKWSFAALVLVVAFIYVRSTRNKGG